ncbi:MAG: S-formylglutathione hydrolase [Gammaproteobacteria bacterium]|nr:S-formylglutathione hydrolase [Gammaproteobacteria bacterium]
MKQIEQVKEFGGWLKRFTHPSETCHCEMTFSVYLPPIAETKKVPVVYWLSGLTCTDDNFRTKAGAQRYASELGLALVIPDTSPRGDNVPDAKDRYDLGQGAGFYVNATQMPWAKNYHMYDYVVSELPALIEKNFPVLADNKSITGHSMGGHGALICALKNPGMYKSVSAFAPICHPTACSWGRNIFKAYLGDKSEAWNEYDASCLIEHGSDELPTLIDQGTDDEFFAEQLFTEHFKAACESKNYPAQIRMQTRYDHSYHFISSFIGEHLKFHGRHLLK